MINEKELKDLNRASMSIFRKLLEKKSELEKLLEDGNEAGRISPWIFVKWQLELNMVNKAIDDIDDQISTQNFNW